jgi:hypothetical protein
MEQTGEPIVQGDSDKTAPSVTAVDGSNGALVTVESEPETEPNSALAAWPSDEQQQQQQGAVVEYYSNGSAVVVYAQQTVSSAIITSIKSCGTSLLFYCGACC